MNYLGKKNQFFYSTNLFIRGIPMDDPGPDIKTIEIEFGNLRYRITGHDKYGLPYGIYAKILMIFIETEITFSKRGLGRITETDGRLRLHFGQSLRDFARLVGYGSDGKTLRHLSDQWEKICRLQISVNYNAKVNPNYPEEFPLTEYRWFCWNNKSSRLTRSYIDISKPYFEYVAVRGFPLLQQVVHNLRSAPMGVDFYKFITYRSYSQRYIQIPLWELRNEFGWNSRVTDIRKSLSDYYTHRILPYHKRIDIRITKRGEISRHPMLIINPRLRRFIHGY
jgi:hypothetical protein